MICKNHILNLKHRFPLISRTIKVECYDWDADGGHDFIGDFTTSLRELTRGPGQTNVYEVTL